VESSRLRDIAARFSHAQRIKPTGADARLEPNVSTTGKNESLSQPVLSPCLTDIACRAYPFPNRGIRYPSGADWFFPRVIGIGGAK
jgi:hypothetical protein